MSKHYDWIVIGGGITGAALAYELAKQGVKTLLLDRIPEPQQASRYSYGGLGYWLGTTPLVRQLAQEGLAIHRQLTAELGSETEFCDRPLLALITSDQDPDAIAAHQATFDHPFTRLTPAEAGELEPLLNPAAIAAALRIPHAQINPIRTTAAYRAAFVRLGGSIRNESVLEWNRNGDRIIGVTTHAATSPVTYHAPQITLCAGAWSRPLLKPLGIDPPLYFTHAAGLEFAPDPSLHLHHIIMPALVQRFHLEAAASAPAVRPQWREPGHEPAAAILDPGAVQFQDGRILFGQASHTLTSLDAPLDPVQSETQLRQALAPLFPTLAPRAAQWFHCLVAFSGNPLPQVGHLRDHGNLSLFSGFSNTLVVTPSLARHFATWALTGEDEVIPQLGFH
ncbi:NAD(P)/FAD-dependent oxidoreductase [Spirulina major]|uniref:NAD(P)/FAD-dependent oxidoreductase n=1 Tax=Spirulina major TaxID=270636 RepID=UPI00093354F2|nr:FAD-binding oxidoreductase [Spirulina major]